MGMLVEMRNEIVCSGLARIEIVGGSTACFVLYRNQRNLRAECGSVIAPMEAIPEAMGLMFQALIESGMNTAALATRRYLGRLAH